MKKASPRNGSTPSKSLPLKKALDHGLLAIERTQEIEGGFPSQASEDMLFDGSMATPRQTSFIASLILLALEPLKEHSAAKRIGSRATTFLLDQKSVHWSWNYWVRGSADDEKHPCPDDLDDTFAALEALHIHAPEQIDGGALASIVRVLTTAEEKPGGPYNTWLVGETADPRWHDIDPVVNANIAAFLTAEHIVLPAVDELVRKTITDICSGESTHSKYYSSPIPTLYFLSRSLHVDRDKELADRVIDFLLKTRGPDGHWSHPVVTACAVTALIRCHAIPDDLESTIRFILDAAEDGSWKAYGLYTETAFGGVPSYAGSEALSTAICLQALALYDQAMGSRRNMNENKNGSTSSPVPFPSPSFSPEALHIERRILGAFENRIDYDPIMHEQARAVLEKVLARDKGKQVALLPYFFKKSLRTSAPAETKINPATERLLIELGLANLSGWVAYRIYDDFLDNEGSPELIPLAALCLREVSAIYNRLLPEPHQRAYTKLMDAMDSANAWERTHTHFPDRRFFDPKTALPDFDRYTMLADKSLPHCLGPIALIIAEHNGRSSQREIQSDVQATTDFFRHYIIARQLNDDAHDWLADIERGFVNSSGTKILKRVRDDGDAASKTFIFREDPQSAHGPFSAETAEFLQKVFWHKVMPGIAEDIYKEIDAARKALVKIGIVSDLSYLESLLLPLEAGADKALSERKRMMTFLAEYQKAPQ